MYCLNCNKKFDFQIKICPTCCSELVEDHDFTDVINILGRFKKGYDPLLEEEFDRDEIFDDDNVQDLIKSILGISTKENLHEDEANRQTKNIRREITNKLNRDADKIYLDLVIWRRKYSEEHDIKPYFVFSNQDLYNIANGDVCEKKDLLEIKGIKETKYKLYADDLMEILKPYIETVENEQFIGKNEYVEDKKVQITKKPGKKDLPNAYKPWTNEDDDALRKMINEEMLLKEIAAMFGRSEGGVIARSVRAGIFENRDEARDYFRKIKLKKK